MKKVLLGTVGMAMATTAMGATAQSPTGQVTVPVTGIITIGNLSQETGIKLSVDKLEFNGNVEAGVHTRIPTQRVQVFKYVGDQDTPLNKGEYKYKVSPSNRTWDDVKQYAITEGQDENYNVFKIDGQGEPVSISAPNVRAPFALKAAAENDALAIWLDGFIDKKYNNKEAHLSANLHVAFKDDVVQP